MKGLLLRLWYGIRIGVLPGAACILILSLISPDTAAFVMPFAALGIAVSLCPVIGSDAASGFERYRLTLPVKRRTIADAYYLTILVLTVILVLFALLLLVWHHAVLIPPYIFYLIALCLLMPAVFLPLTIRFGRVAGMIGAMIVLTLNMLSLPMMIILAIMTIPSEGGEIVSASYSWYELLPGAAAAVLFILSWLFSRRVIEKKRND